MFTHLFSLTSYENLGESNTREDVEPEESDETLQGEVPLDALWMMMRKITRSNWMIWRMQRCTIL